METFESLKSLIQGAEKDAQKFYLRGNRAAGRRLRNAMQRSKLIAQDIRIEVLGIKGKKNAAVRKS